jgi:hypothetical protein
MKWLPWATRKSKPETDPKLASLAERADSIIEELDVVVKQMSTLLREKGSAHE